MLVVIISLLLLTACSSKSEEGHEHLAVGDHKQLPNGDLQEVTASASELPNFLRNQSEDLQLVYEVAAQAEGVLAWMPCYCGCGESAGHGNNFNCFVKEIREDGAVVWDDHGTRCLACVETAITSIQLKQEGKSLKEIRDVIDEQYKEGYAEPTDTPMPA